MTDTTTLRDLAGAALESVLDVLLDDLRVMTLPELLQSMIAADLSANLPARVEVPSSPPPWPEPDSDDEAWRDLEEHCVFCPSHMTTPEEADLAAQFALHRARPLLAQAVGSALVALALRRRQRIAASGAA